MTRSLRIGVVLGGKLVEEHVISAATPITFGQSLRCTLSLPADGLPQQHVLFADGVLRMPPGMTGRLGHGDRLDVLTGGEVRLVRGTRGKLTLGDATVLFQDIATPPAAPRARLPAAVRGTFADRIDRRLAVIVGGSLVAHIAIAAWAWSTDVETQALGAPPVAAYHEDTIDVTLPDLTPVTHEPGIATPVAPAHQTPRPIVRPVAPLAPPSADDALRMASILTDDNETPNHPGGMRPRQPGTDLAAQLDDARHHHVTIGDGGHTSRVDDTARIGTVPDRPLVDDPSFSPTTHHEEPAPGRIAVSPVKTDARTTLTPDTVFDKIRDVYMSGIQRCYRKALAGEPSLAGRMELSFTVDHLGRVLEPSARGLDSLVDDCVASQMKGWHFPAPHDEDAAPTDASFQAPLIFVPGRG